MRDMLAIEIPKGDAWLSSGEQLLEPGHRIKRPRPLFEKIPDKKIAELKNR
jgi:methionyl-tRNA synthetase